MYDAQRLVDQRAAIYGEAKEILVRAAAENRELTGDETAAHTRALADIDRLTDQLDAIDRQAKLDSRFEAIDHINAEQRQRTAPLGTSIEQIVDESRSYADAFAAYLVGGASSLNGEQRNLLESRLMEQRAQGVLTGAGGGYAAPEGFWSKITETMAYYGGMMEVGVESVTTASGNPLAWPTNDDTGNTGSWVGENADLGTATDLSFGAKTLSAHILTSGVLKVSLSYLQDVDAVAGEAFLTRALATRMGRTLNTALTVGNGVSKPQGIITGLSTGKTTASATAITVEELIDLEHSVDRDYRQAGSYMLHDSILAYLRKLQDNDGLPIFQVSYRVGEPNTINGRPFVLNNDMDSTVATTKKTIAFGDFRSCYVMRTVAGGQLMRLTERYADYAQVGFVSMGRYDGLVQDTSACKLLVQG